MNLPLYLPSVFLVDDDDGVPTPQRGVWNAFWTPGVRTVIAVLPSTHTPV